MDWGYFNLAWVVRQLVMSLGLMVDVNVRHTSPTMVLFSFTLWCTYEWATYKQVSIHGHPILSRDFPLDIGKGL